VLVGLRQPEDGDVQPAAVVEVELVGLVDDGLRIHRRAEIQPARRNAADHTRLGRQRDQVDDALLGRDAGHAFRHADAQVHHLMRALSSRAARRAMILRSDRPIGSTLSMGTRISAENAGL
jgi:hypothetical protein